MCILTFLVFVGFVATGCSQKVKNVKRVQVSGKITLDTKPLMTGKITFDPENGEPPAVFDILDGNYEGLAPVGKNKVRLTSIKKVSMKELMGGMDGPGYDELQDVNALPDRYGDKSEITREVTEEGPNQFNFDTKSK